MEQIRLRNQKPSAAYYERDHIYSPAELDKISESMVTGPRHAPHPPQTNTENIVIEKICPYQLG